MADSKQTQRPNLTYEEVARTADELYQSREQSIADGESPDKLTYTQIWNITKGSKAKVRQFFEQWQKNRTFVEGADASTLMNDAYNTMKASINKKLQHEIGKYNDAMTAMEEVESTLKGELRALQDELDALKVQSQKLEKQNLKLTVENDALNERAESCSLEIKEKNESISSLTGDLSRLQAKQLVNDETIENLNRGHAETLSELKSVHNEAIKSLEHSSSTQLTELKKDLSVLKAENSGLEKQVLTLEATVENMKSQASDLKSQQQSMVSREIVTGLETEVSRLQLLIQEKESLIVKKDEIISSTLTQQMAITSLAQPSDKEENRKTDPNPAKI